MRLLLYSLLLCCIQHVTVATTSHEGGEERLEFSAWRRHPQPPQGFALDAVFGDNMVLQREPSRAAVYGFLGPTCVAVQVTLCNQETHNVHLIKNALMNATHQPFGAPDYGVRPCWKQDCPPNDMQPFNPWNHALPTWKVLLPPMPAGGNFSMTAECISNNNSRNNHTMPERSRSSTIQNLTFGDVWYCSGQSNMWLPLEYTFSRNATMSRIQQGKYSNIRIMAGSSANVPYGKGGKEPFNPGYGSKQGINPWMTAQQAVSSNKFLSFGATCWYFAQQLVDLGINDIPLGLANTAIGGQRIEEYASNRSIHACTGRVGQDSQYWDAQLFATQVLPFVDMTVKGWIWYQGEANMGGIKGNSIDNVGYACEMKQLVQGWREIWSQTKGTTDPLAPFGFVTLASSGSAGGSNMGAMRHAQTANYGVAPNPALPNVFLAQAYDLDDEWGPDLGPCVSTWSCCGSKYNPTTCNATLARKCKNACTAAASTQSKGAIHPRSKKPVGNRLGIAALNTVYGGSGAFTGPTLQGCTLVNNTLEIEFDATLLRGDHVVLQTIPPLYRRTQRHAPMAGGSQLYVQTDASHFCMEALPCGNNSSNKCCASWASGSTHNTSATSLDDGWIMLNYTLSSRNSISVDLSPLENDNGTVVVPTAVKYAWGVLDCCDYSDPNLYVTHGCIAKCPIMSSSGLPANPFQAQIVAGTCQCVAPQVCSLPTRIENDGVQVE